MASTSGNKLPHWRSVDAAVLAVAALILVAFRWHAFELPLETDECNYAYIGARLLEGQKLYVDVWDHQPFGVFVLFAGLIALFGDEPIVFRWTATAFSLATMVLIYAIVRRITAGRAPDQGRAAAGAAALLFALVSSDPGTGGEGANREIYMNTLILAAWYLALRWDQATKTANDTHARGGPESGGAQPWWWLIAAGAALAVGSSVKTIVAVPWVLLLVWACPTAAASSSSVNRIRRVGVAIASLGAAPALLWSGAWAWFWGTGRGAEYFDAVFRVNLSYSEGQAGFFSRFAAFLAPPRHPFVFDSAFPLWIATAAGVLILIAALFSRYRTRAGLLLCLVAGAFLAVCMPARFWPHYYYLLIPPAVIVTGCAAVFVADWLVSRSRRRAAGPAVGGVLIGIVGLAVLVSEYRHYLSQPPFGITVNRYNSRDFWGRAQGENVGSVTEPGDRVFVYGNEAEIYYYSGRQCASRYTMLTALAEGMAGADRRRQILMDELRTDPPRVILILFDHQPFPEWRAFLDEHYGEPVGFDRHDRTGEPILFVMARKDQPIRPIDWNWDRSAVTGWFAGSAPPQIRSAREGSGKPQRTATPAP